MVMENKKGEIVDLSDEDIYTADIDDLCEGLDSLSD